MFDVAYFAPELFMIILYSLPDIHSMRRKFHPKRMYQIRSKPGINPFGCDHTSPISYHTINQPVEHSYTQSVSRPAEPVHTFMPPGVFDKRDLTQVI